MDDGTRSLPKEPLQESIDANTFGNNDHQIDAKILGPDRSLSASGGGKVSTSLGDYGAVASLKWSQELRHRVEDWTTFSLGGGELRENTSFSRERMDMKVSLGGMLAWAASEGRTTASLAIPFCYARPGSGTRSRTAGFPPSLTGAVNSASSSTGASSSSSS